MEDVKKAAVIEEMVETEYSESEHYERIFRTTSWLDYIFLWILEYCFKVAGNAELGESENVEAVIGLYFEEDYVS